MKNEKKFKFKNHSFKNLDSLLNNIYNHSNYYNLRKNRYSPYISHTNNYSKSNNYYHIPISNNNSRYSYNTSFLHSNDSYNNINSTPSIINKLRNTIHKTNIIINNNRNYLHNELLKDIKLSKSTKLTKSEKRRSKKKERKKRDLSVESEINNQKMKKKYSKKKKRKKKDISYESEINSEINSEKIKKENEKYDKRNNEEINKLKNLRSELMKTNIDIRVKNKILEVEINNYKKQLYSRKYYSNMNNYSPIFDKDFERYKLLFKESLKENTTNLDKILNLLETNIDIYNQIKSDFSTHKLLFKKLENFNRENAENQILNEENEHKLKSLEIFNEEIIRKKEILNLDLQNWKNKENNSMLQHESAFKKLRETEELMRQLNNRKKLLEEELNKKTEKINFNTKLIYQNKRKLIFYNNKIKNVMDELTNLKSDKNQLIQKNEQIKHNITNYMNTNMHLNKQNNGILLNNLKDEYIQMKNINKEKIIQLKNKEKEIENLKNYIDKNNNNFDFNSNVNFFDLYNQTKSIDLDEINENDIDNNIKLIIEENKRLTINLDKIFNIYDKEIQQKDKIIEQLQKKLKEEKFVKTQNNDISKKYTTPHIYKDEINNLEDSEGENKNKSNENLINNNLDDFDKNEEYFKETQKKNNIKNNKGIKSDRRDIADIDEIPNQNQNNLIKEIKNIGLDKKDMNNNKAQIKFEKKETDDLGEIADKITEYNQSHRFSNKKGQNNNEQLFNNNQINNDISPQQQEKGEFNINNLNLINQKEREEQLIEEDNNEEQNILNNANNNNYNNYQEENEGNNNEIQSIKDIIEEDNALEQNNGEEYELENIDEENNEQEIDNNQYQENEKQDLDIVEDDEFYNDINNINDIHNEYENYGEDNIPIEEKNNNDNI